MNASRNDQASEVSLKFDGTVRIENAEELAALLGEVVKSPLPLVTLDLSAVEEIDVTFVQLLLAFQKSLNVVNRHLMVRALAPDHAVLTTSRLLGLPLEHHLTFVAEES